MAELFKFMGYSGIDDELTCAETLQKQSEVFVKVTLWLQISQGVGDLLRFVNIS